MTALPKHPPAKRLGLAIDLDTCVGCHACATNCKEWNTGGISAPLTDVNAYQAEQRGVWFNRVFTYEVGGEGPQARTVHFPKNCLHCDNAACVTVCPTGASYKRSEDGIVLVDHDKCIGCKLCSWACPYGNREYDEHVGVMKKCTLCVDKIYNKNLAEEDRVPACVAACPSKARHFGDFADPNSTVSKLTRERGGYDLAPESGYQPTSKYLPPRPGQRGGGDAPATAREPSLAGAGRFLKWVDRVLTR